MKYSSARQLPLDFDSGRAPDVERISASIPAGNPASYSSASDLPDFGRYDSAFAITSRIAGRINAASIPDAEHEEFLRERQRLLDKKFAGTISREEAHRLEYIRWTLDRIDDAKHGLVLESLEGHVRGYEQFQADLHSLINQLSAKLPSKKRS